MRLKLFLYKQSSSSRRVLIALAFLGIIDEVEIVEVDLKGGAQHQPYFISLNPIAQVPLLEIWEEGSTEPRYLTQSLAIVQCLQDNLTTNMTFLPLDEPHELTRVLEICCAISDVQQLQNLWTATAIESQGGPSRAVWSKQVIERGFDGLEPMIARSHGTFTVGDNFTAADAWLVGQVANALRWGVDVVQRYPVIWERYTNLLTHEAVRQACPDLVS